MSDYQGSAALARDPQHATFAEANEGTLPAQEENWYPDAQAGGPATDLQRRLHASLTTGDTLSEIPVHPAERALRGVSRAMGYLSLAGAVGLLGWALLG